MIHAEPACQYLAWEWYTPVGLCFVGMPNTHNMFVYLRTRGSKIPLYILEVLVRLMSEGDLDLPSPDPLGVIDSWYQSRTVCRKPLLLVDVESSACKNYFKYEKYLRNSNMLLLLLTQFPSNSLSYYLVLIWKSFDISSSLSNLRCLLGMSVFSHLT